MRNNKNKFFPETLEIFDLFSQKAGSDHIATPVSINAVIALGRQVKNPAVLEIGAGIGTLTYSVAKYCNAPVEVYEDNTFCREELARNLKDFSHQLVIHKSYYSDPNQDEYDLVIIDGPYDQPNGMTKEQVVDKIISSLQRIGFIYVEGHRYSQRIAILKAIRNNQSCSVKHYKSARIDGYSRVFKGGVCITCWAEPSRVKRFVYREYSLNKEYLFAILLRTRKITRKIYRRYINISKELIKKYFPSAVAKYKEKSRL